MENTRCCFIDSTSSFKSSSTYIKYVKKMINYYSTDEIINKFAIGYMINPSLNYSKVWEDGAGLALFR